MSRNTNNFTSRIFGYSLFKETVFYSLGQTVLSSNGCLSNMSGPQIKSARNDIDQKYVIA